MEILKGVTDKSFMSFTYDEVPIEEFGFAVVYGGDRLSTRLHPDFENVVTTVPGRNGTLYWGTEQHGLSFTITVATDCASSRQVANFKNHFRPGRIRRLWFSESEYKYCYAMINTPTSFEFVPFDGEIEVQGVKYHDVIYKGTATLEFSCPDGVFYGREETVIGDNYSDKPWFIESGIPLTSMLPACYLAYGKTNGSLPAVPTTVSAYNAGNAAARTNVCFKRNMSYVEATGSAWASDIIIDTIRIRKPRVFRDIDYTIDLIKAYEPSFTEKKQEVLEDLRENLDSPARSTLIMVVNAIGAGYTVAEGIAAVKSLINGDFSFSLNGIERQSVMTGVLAETAVTSSTPIVENIGDSTTGEYITIDGSKGMLPNGTFEMKEISVKGAIKDLEINFVNTYTA